MSAVLVVTLNPAIDITYSVPHFSLGQTNRVKQVWRLPGGKGINVLRVLQRLEVTAMGLGFLAGQSGQWVDDSLADAGISFDSVSVLGETRSTIAVLNSTQGGDVDGGEGYGHPTELIEPGPQVDTTDAQALLGRIEQTAHSGDYVVVSGSQARGLSQDFTGEIVRIARHTGCTTCVDTSGDVLAVTLQAPPDILKVNETEFRTWLHSTADLSTVDLVHGAKRLIDAGSRAVIVTRGAAGSLVVSRDGQWDVRAPSVTTVNPVGSGDAYLAGLVGELSRGKPLLEAAVFATGCGASNAQFPVAGMIDLPDTLTFAARTRVTFQPWS